MSYVMFSTNTCVRSARQISAPSVVVRGAAKQTAQQFCEPREHLDTRRRADRRPKGALSERCSRRHERRERRTGNCVRNSFVNPYSNIEAAKAKRMKR
jgi:hypothetical protein